MRKEQVNYSLPMITGNLKSPAAEAYRSLRTNIQFAGSGQAVQKLLITSPSPNSGSTTTLINLGIAFSLSGARVLLVDSDLRRPTLHRIFKSRYNQGITDLYFGNNLALEMAVYKSLIDSLYILCSGPVPPNPSEILSSRKFNELVKQMAVSFEYILFDSPPVNAAADAAILSRLVDAVLFVIRHGRITYDEAAHALEQLKKVNANVIGAVMNAVPAGNHAYYYYEYCS